MMAIKSFVISALLICGTLNAQQAPALASRPVDASQYALGPDDQLKIWALGIDEITDKPIRIDPSGNIDLPLIGKVHAAGLTVEQLKAKLIERFAKEVRVPQVSVEIVDFGSQPVSVIGAINQPGVHQLRGHRTLAEVIALANGLKPDAGPRIKIQRQIQYGQIPLPGAKTDATGQVSVAEVKVKELLAGTNPTENILICPHDVITVPAAEMVYVIGAVHKPGGIVLNDNESISVLQALALAEGPGGTAPAAPQNAKILRPIPGTGQNQEIPVDISKIMLGKGENIALKPKDMLFIPESGPKKVASRAVEAAIQMATGVVIWRHP